MDCNIAIPMREGCNFGKPDTCCKLLFRDEKQSQSKCRSEHLRRNGADFVSAFRPSVLPAHTTLPKWQRTGFVANRALLVLGSSIRAAGSSLALRKRHVEAWSEWSSSLCAPSCNQEAGLAQAHGRVVRCS